MATPSENTQEQYIFLASDVSIDDHEATELIERVNRTSLQERKRVMSAAKGNRVVLKLHRYSLSKHAWENQSIVSTIRKEYTSCIAVVFHSRCLDDLIKLYISWVMLCGKCSLVRSLKPLVYLTMQSDGDLNKSRFLNGCLEQDVASDPQAATCIRNMFQSFEFYSMCHIDELFDIVAQSLRSGYRNRCVYQWMTKENGLIDSLAAGLDNERLRCVAAPLIASYLTLHTRMSDGLPGDQWPTNVDFARRHFQKQWGALLPVLLDERRDSQGDLTGQDIDDMGRAYAVVLDTWSTLSLSQETTKSIEDAFVAHADRLSASAEFLKHRCFGDLCVGCLANTGRGLLPCNHSLCNGCLQLMNPEWRSTCRTQVKRCFICDTEFKECLEIKLRPQTSRGRVLSLDGGGVRGIIQLEILELLQDSIELDLPLTDFFDLIVGTSVGGITAFGMGVKGWSVQECRKRLVEFSRAIFPRSIIPKRVSELVFLYKVKFGGALYKADQILRVLKENFGEKTKLIASRPEQTDVAVTTSVLNASHSKLTCEVLTTYSKSRHRQSEAYAWHSSSHRRDVWWAARCTSAVPGLFEPVVDEDGNRRFDGALAFNNPYPVARMEGSLLWDCAPKENFVASVGCGTFPAKTGGHYLLRCVSEKFRAKTETNVTDLCLGDPTGHRSQSYIRLDPLLQGVAEFDFDDAESMYRQQASIRTAVRRNEELGELVRTCAWQLIAQTFYCDAPEELQSSASTTWTVGIYSRLGANVSRILKRWPEAYFVIGKKIIRLASRPWTVDLQKTHKDKSLRITLTEGQCMRQALISGPGTYRGLGDAGFFKSARKRSYALFAS